MVKLKLTRAGRTGIPFYRIVAVEAKTRRDGKYIEKLGIYNPAASPKVLEIDLEKFDAWIKKGAQPTDTVASLAKRLRSAKGTTKSTTKSTSKATTKPTTSTEK